MVLGLIDFLLGGKKKMKSPKTAQVNSPLSNVGGATPAQAGSAVVQPQAGTQPDGTTTPTANATNMQFEESSKSQDSAVPQESNSGRKSMSDVINSIHKELKETNEKIAEMVTDVKSLENGVNELGHRIDDLEESKKVADEKLGGIDGNMTKFLSLYELINNQYNPFVENNGIVEKPKEIVLDNIGSSELSSDEVTDKIKNIDVGNSTNNKDSNLESSLLELDTLNIEQAAGDAVPLTNLKNNTNSLVIILSWLEYLIKRVGIDETRNSLRYYAETLRWIVPEVFFDLDKYLRGMKDKVNLSENERLSVRDHIVSLYFISKLNEKTLDDKLTRAVLQIIKE